MTRPPVHPDVENALDRARLLLARDPPQLPRGCDEEPHASTACPLDGDERAGGDLLAESGGQRKRVQIDPERRAAELGVVAAAETRPELHDARPVRADPHLRVRRALENAEGRCG